MIKLKRLNGYEVVVNAELIEWIDSYPDTTISLATGSKIMVRNSVDDIVEKIMDYRRALSSTGRNPAEVLLKSYKKVETGRNK